jgi:hypothetical protein
MILTVSSQREFIPEFHGNKDLPAAEQIRITHDAPTMSIKEKVSKRAIDLDQNGTPSFHIEIERKPCLRAFNIKISNAGYEKPVSEDTTKGPVKVVGDNKVVVRITNVEDLFNAPVEFDPLIDEIYNYLQNLLNTKVDEKN